MRCYQKYSRFTGQLCPHPLYFLTNIDLTKVNILSAQIFFQGQMFPSPLRECPAHHIMQAQQTSCSPPRNTLHIFPRTNVPLPLREFLAPTTVFNQSDRLVPTQDMTHLFPPSCGWITQSTKPNSSHRGKQLAKLLHKIQIFIKEIHT